MAAKTVQKHKIWIEKWPTMTSLKRPPRLGHSPDWIFTTLCERFGLSCKKSKMAELLFWWFLSRVLGCVWKGTFFCFRRTWSECLALTFENRRFSTLLLPLLYMLLKVHRTMSILLCQRTLCNVGLSYGELLCHRGRMSATSDLFDYIHAIGICFVRLLVNLGIYVFMCSR